MGMKVFNPAQGRLGGLIAMSWISARICCKSRTTVPIIIYSYASR
jgi:hypothetical protein